MGVGGETVSHIWTLIGQCDLLLLSHMQYTCVFYAFCFLSQRSCIMHVQMAQLKHTDKQDTLL